MNKTKRQPMDWENVTHEKEIISKIYTELTKLNIKKKNPVKNWAKDLNKHLPKRTYR